MENIHNTLKDFHNNKDIQQHPELFKSGLRPLKNKCLAEHGNEIDCDGETTVLLWFAGHDIYIHVVVAGVTEILLRGNFTEQ